MRIDPADSVAMLETIRPRQSRPWLQLVNAVVALAGGTARLLRHSETAWASATFSGARHAILLEFAGDQGAAAAEIFIAVLSDHEFTLPGRLVADAAIVAVDQVMVPERRVTVEAELLVLDEG